MRIMNYLLLFLRNQGYDDDDISVAAYGYKKVALFVVNILETLLIGLLFGCVKELSLFLVFFVPLRIFAGGFHFDKLWKCEILSSLIIVVCAIIINNSKSVEFGFFIYLFILLVCFIIHLLFAPQDSDNKRLFYEEKKRYKKIVYTLLFFYTVILFVARLMASKPNGILIPLLLAMTVSGLSVSENVLYERIRHKIQ